MAGHSKWANIKFRKAAQDAKRGKMFTKMIREITISARMGGADQESNPRLRDAVTKALKSNMKRDTIDNAIKRGVGGGEGANLEEVRYEGYGPGGVAVMVDCLTDNKNRTVAEVRHAFTKFGGNLGTDGSVAYLFTKQGQITFSVGADEDKVMEVALESGAEDVQVDPSGAIDVVTTPESFNEVSDAMEAQDLLPENAEVTMNADVKVSLEKETAENMLKMLDMLEDLDDVQNVYSNAEISDEILSELS